MAGAIAFNVVLALFPLLLLGIGVAGFLVSDMADSTQGLVDFLSRIFPQGGDSDISGFVEELTAGLVQRRTGFTVAGSIFLLWIATSLSGTLRVALSEIFDIGAKRGRVHGKLFDVGSVFVGVLLLIINLGVTFVIAGALDLGVSVFGLGDATISFADRVLGFLIAFASIWVLVLLAYRFMPVRHVPWRTAMVAATFTAGAHESLKFAFSWYLTDIANYGSTLGNFATVAVLFFWIYYGSLVFILGGEVGQVYTMRRASRLEVVSFENAT